MFSDFQDVFPTASAAFAWTPRWLRFQVFLSGVVQMVLFSTAQTVSIQSQRCRKYPHWSPDMKRRRLTVLRLVSATWGRRGVHFVEWSPWNLFEAGTRVLWPRIAKITIVDVPVIYRLLLSRICIWDGSILAIVLPIIVVFSVVHFLKKIWFFSWKYYCTIFPAFDQNDFSLLGMDPALFPSAPPKRSQVVKVCQVNFDRTLHAAWRFKSLGPIL